MLQGALSFCLWQKPDARAKNHVGFHFLQRALRNPEKLNVIALTVPAVALRDVRGDRTRSPANLRGHPEKFIFRKGFVNPSTAFAYCLPAYLLLPICPLSYVHTPGIAVWQNWHLPWWI